MCDVEETALQTHGNTLASNLALDVVTSVPADRLVARATRDESARYYFLLPKRRRKQRVSDGNLVTLCAFGPFRGHDAVNFIRTSARALGLL